MKSVLNPEMNENMPEVTPEEVEQHLGSIEIIDVRRPDEYIGELRHIEGSKLVTLGPELMQFLESGDRSKEIVFVCRSGGRSGQATILSRSLGYTHTVNMAGGMILWNELSLPVV